LLTPIRAGVQEERNATPTASLERAAAMCSATNWASEAAIHPLSDES